jgi:hypothetical protein
MTIARKKPLPRSTKPIARKTRVKKVNTKRRAKNKARAYGGEERVTWLKTLPCCVVGRPSSPPVRHFGEIVNAHITTGGMGRKADAKLCVPMCDYHHKNQHLFGTRGFELAYGIDLKAEAAKVEAAWQTQLEQQDRKDIRLPESV